MVLAPESPAQMGLWSDGDAHRVVGVNGKYMGRDGSMSTLNTKSSEAQTR